MITKDDITIAGAEGTVLAYADANMIDGSFFLFNFFQNESFLNMILSRFNQLVNITINCVA